MCSMIFGPNDSPIAGKEGSQLTGSKIGERLNAEAETSVSLRVLPVDGGGESFEVQARGELQLGLLIGEARQLSFTPLPPPPFHPPPSSMHTHPLWCHAGTSFQIFRVRVFCAAPEWSTIARNHLPAVMVQKLQKPFATGAS